MKDGLRRSNFDVQNVDVSESITNDYSDSEGLIVSNITAEENISGGMWVLGSAASGTNPTKVAKGVKFGEGTPFGICLSDTASGNEPEILIRGPYKGLVAEGTVNAGDAIIPGAGAAMNCVQSVGSDAAQFDASDVRGICIMGGGSEATTEVYLK